MSLSTEELGPLPPTLSLFDLPAEIRLRIYELVFHGGHVIYRLSSYKLSQVILYYANYEMRKPSETANPNALLRVSKQCYREAVSTFFSTCAIKLTGKGVNITTIIYRSLEHMTQLRRNVRKLEIDTSGIHYTSIWSTFPGLQKLVLRDNGHLLTGETGTQIPCPDSYLQNDVSKTARCYDFRKVCEHVPDGVDFVMEGEKRFMTPSTGSKWLSVGWVIDYIYDIKRETFIYTQLKPVSRHPSLPTEVVPPPAV